MHTKLYAIIIYDAKDIYSHFTIHWIWRDVWIIVANFYPMVMRYGLYVSTH